MSELIQVSGDETEFNALPDNVKLNRLRDVEVFLDDCHDSPGEGCVVGNIVVTIPLFFLPDDMPEFREDQERHQFLEDLTRVVSKYVHRRVDVHGAANFAADLQDLISFPEEEEER